MFHHPCVLKYSSLLRHITAEHRSGSAQKNNRQPCLKMKPNPEWKLSPKTCTDVLHTVICQQANILETLKKNCNIETIPNAPLWLAALKPLSLHANRWTK